MTSVERGFALWTAVNTVIDNDIPGSFVECGVWRGGSSMLIALILLSQASTDRELFLFDTFEGITPPDPVDCNLHGVPAASLMDGAQGANITELVIARRTGQRAHKDARNAL